MKTTTTTIFLMAAAASLVLGACGGAAAPAPTSAPSQPTAAPAKTSAPAATAMPAPTKAAPTVAPTAAPSFLTGAPNEVLLAAMRRQLKSGPYRTKTVVTADKSTSEIVGEIVPPDKMRMTLDAGGTMIEQIYIGDKGWIKNGGKWTASPGSVAAVLRQFSEEYVADMANTISDVKLAGADVVDGAPTMAFTYNMDMNKSTTMKADVKSSVKVWIRVSDGLVVKQEIDGQAMGVKSHSVQTVQYDPTIKIEPPVK